MGLRFQELSFSVVVEPKDLGESRNAAYLVGAFNSRAFFAFCERVLFSTPYEHGRVAVSSSLPAAIELVKDRRRLFSAAMADGGVTSQREPLRSGNDGWEGAIFLPSKWRQGSSAGKLFYARLHGYTIVYPFLATDYLIIEPSSERDVLRAIRDSKFVAKEWVVRDDAVHAKSQTYDRINALRST
jgi:hypothetical protein